MIAVEDRIKLRDLQALKREGKGIRWKETRNVIEAVRQQKDASELRFISKGSALIDDAFQFARKLIRHKSVLTEIELAQEIETYGKKNGAQAVPFETIVAWGRNASAPHHASSSRKIGTDNFLLLDFGFTVGGYQSDFTRTLFIGKPSAWQRELYETVLDAQQSAINAVMINAKASFVDKVARDHLSQHGYGDYFTHTTGHGVGIEIHELPTLSPKSKDLLTENSIVTVEPGVYLPNKCGVRIEDMVLVGEQPKKFSRVSKEWETIVVAKEG